MTSTAIVATAAFVWLLTPLLSAGLMARSKRARAAIARHLRPCLAVGWFGLAAMAWGATALDTAAGLAAFLAGGPLGGLSIWSQAPGDDGGGDDPPDEPEPGPPCWDWDRFERELRDYEGDRLVGSR